MNSVVSRCTEAVCLSPSSVPSSASSSSSSTSEDTVRYVYYIGVSSTNEVIPKAKSYERVKNEVIPKTKTVCVIILICVIFFSICLDEDCFHNERDNNLLAFAIKYIE